MDGRAGGEGQTRLGLQLHSHGDVYDVGQCQVGLWWKRGRTGEGPVQRLGAGIGLYYKIRYNL